VYLCVLCGSENKQRLFPGIKLTADFVMHTQCAFLLPDIILPETKGKKIVPIG